MLRQAYTGMEDELGIGIHDKETKSEAATFDYEAGLAITFETPDALRKALFSCDEGSAPLQRAFFDSCVPTYRPKGNIVTAHPLIGESLDGNISNIASKIHGVVSVSELVCK